MPTVFYILLSVLINVAAQLFLKQGMTRVGYFELGFNNILPILHRILMNPYVIAGVLSYVLSVTVWLIVLSRVDVSYAYPITSLGYVATAIFAFFLLHEPLSVARVLGIFIIIMGVYLVARS